MTAQDWEFLFDLLDVVPAEGRRMIRELQAKPYDQLLRSALADWFLDHNREPASLLIRKGYTPGGPKLVPGMPPPQEFGSGSVYVPGSHPTIIMSGGYQFGPVPFLGGSLASGTITMNQMRQTPPTAGPAPSTVSGAEWGHAGTLKGPAPASSPYEDFHS